MESRKTSVPTPYIFDTQYIVPHSTSDRNAPSAFCFFLPHYKLLS